jgi:ADP-ribose pyrophosphatase YjhB (NUDIX family)
MEDKPVKGPQVICSTFVEKEGKFLLLFCPRFKVWRVPGGRAGFNETLLETLKREMAEETGIEIKNPRFLGYGQDHQYHFPKQMETSRLLMFFHVKTDQEPRIDPDEAEDFKWVTLDELKEIKNKESGLTDFFQKNPGLKL